MTYQSLYRRYRPDQFSQVQGQTLPLKVVTGALSSGRVGHAYLFSGPRGCGKTTVARLFAKALNCEHPQGVEPCGQCENCKALAQGRSLDIIEIDGASNNSVDEVRELKANVGLSSFSGKWKVYIIDEVHMLSQAAFNALLKTLEEPPERVMFILATTEPFKVPATIRSRCQHLPFQGIAPQMIMETLKKVVEGEGGTCDDEALWELARLSDGGMRDALSLLEQALALGDGKLDLALLEGLIGGGSHHLRCWLSDLIGGDPEAPLRLDALFSNGAVPERVVTTLFELLRNLWLLRRGEGALKALAVSEAEKAWLKQTSELCTTAALEQAMTRMATLVASLRRGLSTTALSGLLSLWCSELAQRPAEPTVGPAPEQASAMRPTRPSKQESPHTEQKPQPAATPLPQESQPHHQLHSEVSEDLVPQSLEKEVALKDLGKELEAFDPFFVALRLLGREEIQENKWVLHLPEGETLAFELARAQRRMDKLVQKLPRWNVQPQQVEIRCGAQGVSLADFVMKDYVPTARAQAPQRRSAPQPSEGKSEAKAKDNEPAEEVPQPEPLPQPQKGEPRPTPEKVQAERTQNHPQPQPRATGPSRSGSSFTRKERSPSIARGEFVTTEQVPNGLLRELVLEAQQESGCPLLFARSDGEMSTEERE